MTDRSVFPEATPLVSVIIPCYNATLFVGEAIESALSQDYPNVEVIVIDDGSTDDSLEVLRSFGDHVSWEAGPRRGGGAARNRGLEIARGQLIQFLDADDWLLPGKIESQIQRMRNMDGGIPCSGRFEAGTFGEKECRLEVELVPPEMDTLAWVIREAQALRTASPLHRKDALLRIGGFDVELPAAQEYDLHIRLAAHGYRFEYDAVPLWVARRVGGSVSSSVERVFDQHPKIFMRAKRVAEPNGLYSHDVARSIGQVLMKDARWYSLNGFNKKMRQFHATAARFDAGASSHFYESNRVLMWIAALSGSTNAERLVRFRRRGFVNN